MNGIKAPHLAAMGLLLTSIAAQFATLTDWSQATRPVFIGALLTAIGSTLVALFSDKPRDPEAQTRISDPRAPMMLLPLLLAGALTMTACASGGPRHIATVSIVSAHATLSAIQDTEMMLVCGKPTAPAVPQCIDGEKHKTLSGKLAQAFGYDAQIARTIRAMPAGSPTPVEVTNMLAQVAVLVNQILADLPRDAPPTETLLQNLKGGQ